MLSNPPPRGFPPTEFAARTKRAQALMAAQGLDGILLTTEAEVRYFTGFHTLFWQSPTRPWFVFVPTEGKPIAVIPEIGAALMSQTWITDIRTWAAPNPTDDGISLLADLLGPLENIGLPMGHETQLRMPLGDWNALITRLPNLVIKDATKIIQSLRMVKSAAEIQKIAHICQIGSATFDAVPSLAHAGQPLEDTFRAFRREALAQGADDVPYLVGASEQGGYADVISPPTHAPLQTGDVLMLDTGCTWDGYFCDFDRNWAIDAATDTARCAYNTLWRATQAGLEAAKLGNTCRDLFNAMSSVIAKTQTSGGDVGRLGHGLGMQLTEQPSIAAFDDTVLVENMVLTLEPSLRYSDGLMMVHEENIVITAGGAKLLTKRAAPELPVITA